MSHSAGETSPTAVQRGESENRNKELKCRLGIDRLSDHRFVANFFRLYLHVAAPRHVLVLPGRFDHALLPGGTSTAAATETEDDAE